MEQIIESGFVNLTVISFIFASLRGLKACYAVFVIVFRGKTAFSEFHSKPSSRRRFAFVEIELLWNEIC